jgi:hypothetical protein
MRMRDGAPRQGQPRQGQPREGLCCVKPQGKRRQPRPWGYEPASIILPREGQICGSSYCRLLRYRYANTYFTMRVCIGFPTTDLPLPGQCLYMLHKPQGRGALNFVVSAPRAFTTRFASAFPGALHSAAPPGAELGGNAVPRRG